MRVLQESKTVQLKAKEAGKVLASHIEDGWNVQSSMDAGNGETRITFVRDTPAE